jgi:hypothetical protein
MNSWFVALSSASAHPLNSALPGGFSLDFHYFQCSAMRIELAHRRIKWSTRAE